MTERQIGQVCPNSSICSLHPWTTNIQLYLSPRRPVFDEWKYLSSYNSKNMYDMNVLSYHTYFTVTEFERGHIYFPKYQHNSKSIEYTALKCIISQ